MDKTIVPQSFDRASALTGKDMAVANSLVQQYLADNPDATQQDAEAYLYTLIQDDSNPPSQDDNSSAMHLWLRYQAYSI